MQNAPESDSESSAKAGDSKVLRENRGDIIYDVLQNASKSPPLLRLWPWPWNYWMRLGFQAIRNSMALRPVGSPIYGWAG